MKGTPRAGRLHIGIFGRVNSGKSSLINALTGQETAIVSGVPGTTTDAVSKSMEIPGLGPVTFIDTAGFGDDSALGGARVAKTMEAAGRADVAVVVFSAECADDGYANEKEWVELFRERNIPVIGVLNKADIADDPDAAARDIETRTGLRPVAVSARTGAGIEALMESLVSAGGNAAEPMTVTGDLVSAGDVVMLVMPQDPQAPKGRLILPQAQTIRELLDKKCISVSCTPDKMAETLAALKSPPRLIITDSQVFAEVEKLTPPESLLTSFSVLFARYKGDARCFIEGAAAIDRLTPDSAVLIAEACTHAPLSEDIGRVKLPKMLRARVGEGLRVDVVAGNDFPADLSAYDLVIHCGACMFNRRHVMSRVDQACAQEVPITNYGVAIAHLKGILGRVVYPGGEV